MAIDPEHLRAYARRPWAEMERAKREYVAERWREDPEEHARSIARLREHLRTVRPEWPTPDELARDFADHVALKRKIDRAADAAVSAGVVRRADPTQFCRPGSPGTPAETRLHDRRR